MSKFDKLFDIPEELSSDIPKVTIVGFNRMLIENYKSVLDYQDFFIRVKMKTGLQETLKVWILKNTSRRYFLCGLKY